MLKFFSDSPPPPTPPPQSNDCPWILNSMNDAQPMCEMFKLQGIRSCRPCRQCTLKAPNDHDEYRGDNWTQFLRGCKPARRKLAKNIAIAIANTVKPIHGKPLCAWPTINRHQQHWCHTCDLHASTVRKQPQTLVRRMVESSSIVPLQ